MKKVGLFFGSFNPVHIGHMVIANYFVEYADLEEVWFIVSPQNPFKKKSTLLQEYHRLELLRLAIDDDPRLRVSDIEFSMPKPSYTVDTLAYLGEKYDHEFILIMGSDQLKNLHRWKNIDVIHEFYRIFVYPRPGFEKDAIDQPNVKVFDVPLMEISSSFIRKAIKEGKDMRFMLPFKTYQAIKKSGYYL